MTPSTGQKEAVPQWYDVETAKGTQYTVTGYSVPVGGTDTEQVHTLTATLTHTHSFMNTASQGSESGVATRQGIQI